MSTRIKSNSLVGDAFISTLFIFRKEKFKDNNNEVGWKNFHRWHLTFKEDQSIMLMENHTIPEFSFLLNQLFFNFYFKYLLKIIFSECPAHFFYNKQVCYMNDECIPLHG